jgi:hypothetical protein
LTDGRTLYIHVGTPKTATSLAQDHFATGALDRHGIQYPLAGRPPRRPGHHLLGHAVMASDFEAARTQLDAMDAPCGKRLLSTEAFSNGLADPRRIDLLEQVFAHAGQGFERTVVIVFLREASTFFESMYLQSMKAAGLRVPFADYLKARGAWYPTLFASLDRLGRRMEVRAYPFVPSRYARDWDAALDTPIGLDTRARRNPRLSLKSQLFLRDYEELDAEAALPMSRRKAIKAFAAAPPPFEDDTPDFTLYWPSLAAGVHGAAIAGATGTAGAAYRDAFAGTPGTTRVPVAVHEMALGARDVAAGRAFLAAMAPAMRADNGAAKD